MVTTKLKTMFAPEKRLENGTSEFHPRVFHVYHSFYIKKFVFIFILSSYFTLNIFVLLKQLRINLKFWEASEGTQPGRAAWKSQIRISEKEKENKGNEGGQSSHPEVPWCWNSIPMGQCWWWAWPRDQDSQGAGGEGVCGQVSLFQILRRQLLSGLEREVKGVSG